MSAKEVVVEICPPRKKGKRVKIILWIPQELFQSLVKVTVGENTLQDMSLRDNPEGEEA